MKCPTKGEEGSRGAPCSVVGGGLEGADQVGLGEKRAGVQLVRGLEAGRAQRRKWSQDPSVLSVLG